MIPYNPNSKGHTPPIVICGTTETGEQGGEDTIVVEFPTGLEVTLPPGPLTVNVEGEVAIEKQKWTIGEGGMCDYFGNEDKTVAAGAARVKIKHKQFDVEAGKEDIIICDKDGKEIGRACYEDEICIDKMTYPSLCLEDFVKEIQIKAQGNNYLLMVYYPSTNVPPNPIANSN